jgi:hypothetical protein
VSLQFSIAKQVGWAKPRWGIRFFGGIELRLFGETLAKNGGGLMLEGLESGELGMCGVGYDLGFLCTQKGYTAPI